MANSIFVIHPYCEHGVWQFDDAERGLLKEAFVAGADELIERAARLLLIPNPENGITILFSDSEFPGCQFSLRHTHAEFDGNWYYCRELKRDGWFCPALLKFFPEPPKFLYAQVKA